MSKMLSINGVGLVLLALFSILFPVLAAAHHSFATHYIPSEPFELKGSVVEFRLRSPHSEMVLDVIDENGQLQRWQVEAAASAHLRRMGIQPNTFEVGDDISVTAWPNRKPGNPLVFGNSFVAANGDRFGGAPDLTVTATADTESSGIDSMVGRWQVPYPKRLSAPPMSLSAAGQAAWDNYDPQLSPANTCETSSIPGILYAPFLADIQMTDEQVVFRFEHYALVRTVPLNGEPALGDPEGVFGMVSASIEGDELVIESSGYSASGWGLALAAQVGADIPSSAEKTIVERYSMTDGGNILAVAFSIEDSVYLAAPYEQIVPLARVADDEPMFDFVCEQDSAERFSRDP